MLGYPQALPLGPILKRWQPTDAIFFYLSLRRQPTQPFTYPYDGSNVLHYGTKLGYPQALPLVPILTRRQPTAAIFF